MPQSERSDTIKQLLKWIASQENGATTQAIVQYVKWEITEGGATDNAARKYIEDLDHAKKMEYNHPFWKVTKAGLNWLERHTI